MSISQLRFLLVEDQPFQREMLKRAVANLGVSHIHEAGSGQDALRILGNGEVAIDIVITDLVLPDIDGIELLSHLEANKARFSLIYLSASQWSLEAAFEIAQASGFKVLGTAVKPVTQDRLAELIAGHPLLAEAVPPSHA